MHFWSRCINLFLSTGSSTLNRLVGILSQNSPVTLTPSTSFATQLLYNIFPSSPNRAGRAFPHATAGAITTVTSSDRDDLCVRAGYRHHKSSEIHILSNAGTYGSPGISNPLFNDIRLH